jgi:hypothetical protein
VTGAVLSGVPGLAPGTTATVGGEVNPEGNDTRYYVQYGTGSEEFAQTTSMLLGNDAGSGISSVVLGGEGAPPDVLLEGLTGGAVYHYRLVATNEDGTTYGSPQTVTVPPRPAVGPASVSEVTQSSATVTTSVNPEGLHTLYKLEIGTSTAYGTPYSGDAGSGSAQVPLTFDLTELEPGTTYHFLLYAANGDGTSTEADQTFTTAPGPQGFVPVFTITASLPELAFSAAAFPTETGTTTPQRVITIIRHGTEGKTATIIVSVPSAGRLTASGAGLSKATRKATKAGEVTITLKLSKPQQRVLARRHGRKLAEHIKLTFTSSNTETLTRSVTVLFH